MCENEIQPNRQVNYGYPHGDSNWIFFSLNKLTCTHIHDSVYFQVQTVLDAEVIISAKPMSAYSERAD